MTSDDTGCYNIVSAATWGCSPKSCGALHELEYDDNILNMKSVGFTPLLVPRLRSIKLRTAGTTATPFASQWEYRGCCGYTKRLGS